MTLWLLIAWIAGLSLAVAVLGGRMSLAEKGYTALAGGGVCMLGGLSLGLAVVLVIHAWGFI